MDRKVHGADCDVNGIKGVWRAINSIRNKPGLLWPSHTFTVRNEESTNICEIQKIVNGTTSVVRRTELCVEQVYFHAGITTTLRIEESRKHHGLDQIVSEVYSFAQHLHVCIE